MQIKAFHFKIRKINATGQEDSFVWKNNLTNFKKIKNKFFLFSIKKKNFPFMGYLKNEKLIRS